MVIRAKEDLVSRKAVEPGTVTPVQLLSELSLTRENLRENSLASLIEQFRTRKRAFEWIHLGTTDVTIGKLLDLIHNTPQLLPPRTGHMGNWEEIVRGRAGMMDFNKSVCAGRYGYPLIYCFNQTEDAAMQHGDWVYLPGSSVENGQRTVLPLFTWDGTHFVRRSREEPLFTPFVQTEVGGHLISITEFHWRRMQRLGTFPFRLEASIIRENEAFVKEILHVLLDEAAHQNNARRAFQDLLSHQVTLDGRMRRMDLQRVGRGYRMGKAYYANAEELVDAAILPYLAVTEPNVFFDRIREFPNYLPIMSNVLTGVLSAIFCTHYPGYSIERALMTQPFNPHFHWGARAMAGYPPKRRGYFYEKSTIKSYRKICQTIIRNFSTVDPIFIVLMPVVIFALCPTDCHAGDRERLEVLFREVKRSTDPFSPQSDLMMQEVERVVAQWLQNNEGKLSRYFLNRFYPRQGILNEGESHTFSTPVEPAGFRELTIRQACMIVGALFNT
ncbi:DUF6025 family protein [Numidum massiliense]|uniref:DUF6025 family protein n=1 Tax=Numidum massiliense TaxID=1522315 RepID=UPI0006D5842A|nr:DUF6025 family protein [Numidum massiliense]